MLSQAANLPSASTYNKDRGPDCASTGWTLAAYPSSSNCDRLEIDARYELLIGRKMAVRALRRIEENG